MTEEQRGYGMVEKQENFLLWKPLFAIGCIFPRIISLAIETALLAIRRQSSAQRVGLRLTGH
jgi:hypothetical protein